MTKETILNQTIQSLSRLPAEKIREVADYAEFLLRKHEDEVIKKGIEKMIENSKAYSFLNEEEDLYSVNDLKERYK